MKTNQNFKNGLVLFVLAIGFTLFGMQCEKDQNIPEIDKLPPATQIGADTFGCLVDGKALIPRKKGWSGSGVLQCDYQYINSGNKNGHYFMLGGSDEKTYPDAIHDVTLRANAVELEEKTYVLDEYDIPGKLNGEFTIFLNGVNEYTTNQLYKGELTITNFDPVNYIISGTFWFDAVNKNGEKVEVREGRFDVHYTL
jgi:hypothetical protein